MVAKNKPARKPAKPRYRDGTEMIVPYGAFPKKRKAKKKSRGLIDSQLVISACQSVVIILGRLQAAARRGKYST